MEYKITDDLRGIRRVSYKCERCASPLESPLVEAGTKQKCPTCQTPFVSPGVKELEAHRAAEAVLIKRRAEADDARRLYAEQQQRDQADRAVAEQARAVANAGPYVYKMVQTPQVICTASAERGNEAAEYLQGVVNKLAYDGWEFYRVDQIGVQVASGCLGSLLQIPDRTTFYYVATFRKARGKAE